MLVEYKKVKIYQLDEAPVLDIADFHVDDCEFIYIIGRVGSGKSSLLKTLYCELDIDEAEKAVVLDNDLTTIRRRQIPALRKQLGIIFQDFQLLADRTVYKNLYFVLKATGWEKADIDSRISEVLEQVGMTEKALRMPHQLSGGEQQRVAIARALLNSPKLIIADEPTCNLDPETADGIMQLFRQISQTGTAIIMSTHNMPLLDKYPGIVYRCAEGKLEEITGDYNKMIISEDEEEEQG